MTLPFKQRIEKALDSRREQGLTRRLRCLDGGNQPELTEGGQRYVNFSSNDYLGLACDSELAAQWQQGIARYGNGSGASPLVTGFSHPHRELEAALCDWLDYPRAVLFGSGFSANQAMLFSLLQQDDYLLQDKLNHASLIEAGLLSPATMRRFRHNSVENLSAMLKPQQNTLVVTEGVFSMDGDCAPLAKISAAVRDSAWLAVDDAHGIGVLGEEGRGSIDVHNVKPQLLVVTFGKAFGMSGAAILCDHAVGDYLTQFARHHVYSTAIPPAQAFALTHAVKMIRTQQWRREKSAELRAFYDEQLSQLAGFVATDTPIKPFQLGDSQRALEAGEQLRQRGLWLTAIRPPTVPQGSARLRITITANHTKAQLAKLATSLSHIMERQS
ncbi:8-amino-7-oxononanoate synthase [Vibrio sp.]|uniref:8-amino-7-oxononanoate synthase n=1 Tax=Vibrio sp. TaxID=678 RepID=UPI003D096A9F